MPLHPSAALALQLADELNAVIFPVRRDKQAAVRRWQKLTREQTGTTSFLQGFSDQCPSLGVLLGPASGHLCSIDLDSDEWLERFLVANPRLRSSLISRGARGGNVWVRLRGDYPTLRKLRCDGEAVGEWRSRGGYTVIAGHHPSGCEYHRNKEKLVELEFKDITWPDGVSLGGSKPRISLKPSSNSSAALPACNSAPLPLCISAPLHNSMDDVSGEEGNRSTPRVPAPAAAPESAPPRLTAAQVLAHQQAESAARTRLERESPGLARLNAQMLDHHYEARPHERNAAIVEAVPFLFRAVAEKFVVQLVCHFHERHAPLFRDPLTQHREEAETMLAAVRETYLASLPADEAALYRSLPEDQRDTYRICRDLAARPEPPAEPGTFFLSADQLALRLGIYPMQAQRHLAKLRSLPVMELAVPGTKRAAGRAGRATTYRWLLPLGASA